MGRKSGRTKIGRSINPADAHRKQQRKKELKKNKEERKRVRLIASANKDLTKLEDELKQLKEIEKERYLDKYEKDKKKSLEEEISKVKEAREKLGLPINTEKKTTGQETVKLLGIHSSKHDKHDDKKSKSKKYSSSESESDSESDSSESDSSYSSDSSSKSDSSHKHKHKHDSDNPEEIDQDDIDIDDIAQAEMMEEMEKMLPLINEEDLYNIELPTEPMPPEDKRLKIFQTLIDIPEIKAKVNTPIPNISLPPPIFQQIPPMNGNVPFMGPPGMIRPNGNFRPPPNMPIPMNPNGRPPMMVYPPNVRPPINVPIPPNGMIPMPIPPNASVRPISGRPIPMNHPPHPHPHPHPHPNKVYKPASAPGVHAHPTNTQETAPKKPVVPAASAVISAAPQLRDLQKELTTLVPSSLRRRGQTSNKLSRKSTVSSNSLNPTINLAPEFDENGDIKMDPIADNSKSKDNTTSSTTNTKQDDYEAFMKEVSELL